MEYRKNRKTVKTIDQRISRYKFKYYLCHLKQYKNMKKIKVVLLLLAVIFLTQEIMAQALSESTKRKFTVGVNLYTTWWQTDFVNPAVKPRTIHQGVDVFFMYNVAFKPNSLNAFSIGLEIRNENMYTNATINDIHADTIVFTPIEENYKRSKVNFTYIGIPAELKFRTKKGFKTNIGFKVGYKIDSKQLFVGDRPSDNKSVKVKTKRVNQTEDFSFGPYLRIGYKWITVYAYYEISKKFKSDLGPKVSAVSLGISVTPF